MSCTYTDQDLGDTMRRSLAPIAILGLALTGCGSSASAEKPTKDEVMQENCTMLASFSESGDLGKRDQLVDLLGKNIDHAPQQLQDAYSGVKNSQDKPESSWTLALDSYAQTCFDLGWEG